jgi:hypothetical protein
MYGWFRKASVFAAILACALAVIYGFPSGRTGPSLNVTSAEHEENLLRPLIYFSEDEPDGNATVRKQIIEDLQLPEEWDVSLVFGQNRIGDHSVLIVRGRRDTANRFDHVIQLFTFLINNGWHSRNLGYNFDKLTKRLFYASQPLELTCGKFSTYFSTLAVKEMGVEPRHIRSVTNYKANWRKGHAFREMYFPDLQKWVMLDVDAGVVPVLDGEPLSTLEFSLIGVDEYEKAIQAGLDTYGRGDMGHHSSERDYAKGPGANGYADRKFRERRKTFAVGKKHRFTQCSPEEYAIWKKATEHRRNITVSCNTDEYRARFYPVPRRDGVPSDVSMSSNVPWGYPMRGVSRLEFSSQEGLYARWTRGTATLRTVLLGQPRDVVLLLTVKGAPAAVRDRSLTVTVNEQRITDTVSPIWEDGIQTVEVPIEASALKPGTNVVEITTPTWRPSEVLGRGDSRELGVYLVSMKWRPATAKAGSP